MTTFRDAIPGLLERAAKTKKPIIFGPLRLYGATWGVIVLSSDGGADVQITRVNLQLREDQADIAVKVRMDLFVSLIAAKVRSKLGVLVIDCDCELQAAKFGASAFPTPRMCSLRDDIARELEATTVH